MRKNLVEELVEVYLQRWMCAVCGQGEIRAHLHLPPVMSRPGPSGPVALYPHACNHCGMEYQDPVRFPHPIYKSIGGGK